MDYYYVLFEIDDFLKKRNAAVENAKLILKSLPISALFAPFLYTPVDAPDGERIGTEALTLDWAFSDPWHPLLCASNLIVTEKARTDLESLQSFFEGLIAFQADHLNKNLKVPKVRSVLGASLGVEPLFPFAVNDSGVRDPLFVRGGAKLSATMVALACACADQGTQSGKRASAWASKAIGKFQQFASETILLQWESNLTPRLDPTFTTILRCYDTTTPGWETRMVCYTCGMYRTLSLISSCTYCNTVANTWDDCKFCKTKASCKKMRCTMLSSLDDAGLWVPTSWSPLANERFEESYYDVDLKKEVTVKEEAADPNDWYGSGIWFKAIHKSLSRVIVYKKDLRTLGKTLQNMYAADKSNETFLALLLSYDRLDDDLATLTITKDEFPTLPDCTMLLAMFNVLYLMWKTLNSNKEGFERIVDDFFENVRVFYEDIMVWCDVLSSPEIKKRLVYTESVQPRYVAFQNQMCVDGQLWTTLRDDPLVFQVGGFNPKTNELCNISLVVSNIVRSISDIRFIPKYDHAVSSTEAAFYVTGGCDNTNAIVKDVQKFTYGAIDLEGIMSSLHVENLQPLLEARCCHALSIEGNVLLCTGGVGPDGKLSDTIMAFTTETGWTYVSKTLNQPRACHATVITQDNDGTHYLVVSGGCTDLTFVPSTAFMRCKISFRTPTGTHEVSLVGEWEDLPPTPKIMAKHAMKVYDTEIVCVGGERTGNNIKKSKSYFYSREQKKWVDEHVTQLNRRTLISSGPAPATKPVDQTSVNFAVTNLLAHGRKTANAVPVFEEFDLVTSMWLASVTSEGRDVPVNLATILGVSDVDITS